MPYQNSWDVAFKDKPAIDPDHWLCLEKGSKDKTMRAVDLLAPIGKGQRGLIVSPPKAGKTILLKELCKTFARIEPEMKLYCFLADERPEEVTDFKREVTAQVFASSSDRAQEEHTAMAQEVMAKASAEAASGADVAIFLDSLTRLSRAHNVASNSRRTLSGGLDSRAMEIPRKFFGAARKLEGGGSLTILATILVDTGSRMDEVIFQEFKGTGNMELVLSRPAAEARLFPAINVRSTGTRKEEKILPEETLQGVWKLRRVLSSLPDLEATRKLIELLEEYPTNQQLLKFLFG
ncbi:MAG: transcription termination factor Rho [Elusimicrobia bacterium]|nr:transcription termination factor Rho [Elusimicrobiota bacterium]